MKRFALAAGAALFIIGPALADPLSPMYGNTLIVTTPDGKTSKAYVNQDMTWEQHMADGSVLKGTLAWKDASTACFTQTDPSPKVGSTPTCNKVDEHKVGDTWTQTDEKNQKTTYVLTAGR